MKVSILTVVVLLELSAHIHGSCDIAGNQLSCTEFNDNFLAYSNEYENVTYVRLSGDFTEIGFDSRFIKLSTVYINSESLVNFNMNNLNNLTSLKSVYEMSNHNMTVDLNVTGDSDTFKYLSLLSFRRVENILGSFTSFTKLKEIDLYQYEKEYFDFSLLPNSLGRLGISSSRATKLVNEIRLKRLPYLTQLYLSQATLNASFIPSSLKFLLIKNLISQEDLVGTNINRLDLRQSQTPLEFIPTNLWRLWLSSTELNVTCEHLQKSKIDFLNIDNNRGSFDMNCLPMSLTSLSLQGNKIQNINLKPLISHLYIKVMYLHNPINCTCETFRDFVQIVSKQQTEIWRFNCATSSLLSGYPFEGRYNALASLIQLQDYNQRHQNCSLAEKQAETVTSRAEVTTESNVVPTLPSASPRLVSTVSASIVSAVASFLLLFIVTSQ